MNSCVFLVMMLLSFYSGYCDVVVSSVNPKIPEVLPKLKNGASNPEIRRMDVISNVESRYAKTVISSRVANPANKSQEVFFSVVLPESAFISGFLMEINDQVYEAYVKEKEEAKAEYDKAVESGLSAGHVAVSARDSNKFTISVNVEPQTKVTFNLTYEELLDRRLGLYTLVMNLNPGQIVKEMNVDVHIKEHRNISEIKVPEIRSGNEVVPSDKEKENELAEITRISPSEVRVKFSPTPNQQSMFSKKKQKDGIEGQFVVQYDVVRDPQAGEVLVTDGYFVHFFAPSDLQPLRKHVIFVLDVSGSMSGRKIEQLKEAMDSILADLHEGDLFNIIEFSYSVKVWNLDSSAASPVYSPSNTFEDDQSIANGEKVMPYPATENYKQKAKEIIKKMSAGGGTNLYDSLKTALQTAHEANYTHLATEVPEPIIIFLTDGEPTVGETRPDKILAVVDENNNNKKTAVFSLAFGDDADLQFLRKLSLRNNGFARKIYEASDASLQLKDFYRQVASPLLSNVTFNYFKSQVDETSLTKCTFHSLFRGGEIVVAGKLADNATKDGELGSVDGNSLHGVSSFPIRDVFWPLPQIPLVRKITSLERLWAYLTIKQLLDEQEAQDDDTTDKTPQIGSSETVDNSTDIQIKPEDPKKRALKLALEYKFVTSLTSLVVVKPNETSAVDLDSLKPVSGSNFIHALPLAGSFGVADRIGGPMMLAKPGSNFYVTTTYRPLHTQATTHGLEAADSDLETTTLEPESEETYLVSLQDLEWFVIMTDYLITPSLILPVGPNQTEVTVPFKDSNATDAPFQTCVTPTGIAGHCRHLVHCSLSSFKKNVESYYGFFCKIKGKFAGACCPDNLFPSSETTEAEVTTTTTTTL